MHHDLRIIRDVKGNWSKSAALTPSTTVNVEIFASYIFSRNLRFSNIRQYMYIVKITFIGPYRDNNIKNGNIDPREISIFCKFAKMYTRENT